MVEAGPAGPIADRLADTGEERWACVTLFASARCAGADVKALVPAGQAALVLGASKLDLVHDSPPFSDETQYLDEAERIRYVLLQKMDKSRRLIHGAAEQDQIGWAWIMAALAKNPVDEGLLAAGQWLVSDAAHATQVSEDSIEQRQRAVRCLIRVPIVFAETYDGTVDFVKRGGLMPYAGRWITGEKPKPTVRWHG